jgi:hypothetical protein
MVVLCRIVRIKCYFKCSTLISLNVKPPTEKLRASLCMPPSFSLLQRPAIPLNFSLSCSPLSQRPCLWPPVSSANLAVFVHWGKLRGLSSVQPSLWLLPPWCYLFIFPDRPHFSSGSAQAQEGEGFILFYRKDLFPLLWLVLSLSWVPGKNRYFHSISCACVWQGPRVRLGGRLHWSPMWGKPGEINGQTL